MFYTIEKEINTELMEKKSKFIANLSQVKSKQAAENKIK